MAFSSAVKHALSEAGSWLLAAVIVIASIAYFDELKTGLSTALGLLTSAEGPNLETALPAPSTAVAPLGSVEIRAGRDGHFKTTAHLNGHAVDVLVDTGASMVALSYDDAERAGVFVRASEFTHRVSTANGTAKIALVRLDSVSIGDITIRNVEAMVSEPERLATSLLGMSFLGRLSRAEMRNGVLVLQE